MEERVGDRELWQPDDLNLKTSQAENERVRKLLTAALQVAVDADDSDGSLDAKWGHARGQFARDWVALSHKLGIKGPGEDRRAPLEEDTVEAREIDAGRTRLRQILEGHLEQEWVLVGVESVCNDRLGLALPGKAYQVQTRLEVD